MVNVILRLLENFLIFLKFSEKTMIFEKKICVQKKKKKFCTQKIFLIFFLDSTESQLSNALSNIKNGQKLEFVSFFKVYKRNIQI